MNIKEVIISQYHASLEMLKEAIIKCPESLWDEPEARNKFWHVSYHALFYTHLYLQKSEAHFKPWPKHREDYESMEPLPDPPGREPYSKAEILDYLQFCQQEVETAVAALDLEQESGFYWLPFNKLELQLYNIRHVQQHAGELSERLGTQANIEVDWVGQK